MKSFASNSFFRLFDRAVRPADMVAGASTWSRDGVDWVHVRHTFRGVDHQFSMDVFTGTWRGKKGWSVVVVREGWWVERKSDPIRTTQWAHLISGNRGDALTWFEAQETTPIR